MLSAGIEGIKNKTEPADSVRKNIFKLTDAEKEELGIGALPGSLQEALVEMQSSEFVRNTLGDHVFNNYLCAKTAEWDEYKAQVHQWELDAYLSRL
jgi:glutamine synthetase